MGKIIGIDLGTSNTSVSVFDDNEPIVIANSDGKKNTPSVVSFTREGDCLIGDPAKQQAIYNARNTVYSYKRFMGEMWKQNENDISRVTFSVVNVEGSPHIDIYGRKYTPQEISAIMLRKMKNMAEDYLGQEVSEAVITVPACFSDSQRQATIEAGQNAGLNVRRIVNAPTAAALAYGFNKTDKDMKIAVIDFGGGSFDISILDFGGGVFEVLSTNSNICLGGDDFDQVIVDWLASSFMAEEGVDLRQDPMALRCLKEVAEKAKISLSNVTSTLITLPCITINNGKLKHFVKRLTRDEFE